MKNQDKNNGKTAAGFSAERYRQFAQQTDLTLTGAVFAQTST